jgi:prepilin-type N-terminal cleavage/methylation domain-containing protein
MTMKFQVESYSLQVRQTNGRRCAVSTFNLQPSTFNCCAFTLVEMLVTLALLSLIVLALMAVFNSTQAAFRSSLTETDILESGRNTMDLIADDLAQMTPSYGTNLNMLYGSPLSYINLNAIPSVNFYANLNYNPYPFFYQPLIQALPGTTAQRTNLLENFFILSRQNVNGTPSWVGTGYVVDPASSPTNALYRFTMTTNVINGNPVALASNFIYAVNYRIGNPFTNTTYWSHLVDGVVDLTVRPYDPNGLEMTNTYEYYNYNGSTKTNIFPNAYFARAAVRLPYLTAASQAYGFYMFSNTVPASVEVNLGVVEDAVLQHAEGLPSGAALNYLSNHVGQVHLFRQRVWIRSVDPTAYQ